MAKIEFTPTELRELLNLEIEAPELKKQIANELLKVFGTKEMDAVIAEKLDKKVSSYIKSHTKELLRQAMGYYQDEFKEFIRELVKEEVKKVLRQ